MAEGLSNPSSMAPQSQTQAQVLCVTPLLPLHVSELLTSAWSSITGSVPPPSQGVAPVQQGTEPCLFTDYRSSVVSARKWKKYWKINTSVTCLARKDCPGARSVRCVWGVRVSEAAILRVRHRTISLCCTVFQAVGLTSIWEWISHWVTSVIDFHRTGVSSQAERPTDFPAVLVLQLVGKSPRKYILSEWADLSNRVLFMAICHF